jgi:hypothetical protein
MLQRLVSLRTKADQKYYGHSSSPTYHPAGLQQGMSLQLRLEQLQTQSNLQRMQQAQQLPQQQQGPQQGRRQAAGQQQQAPSDNLLLLLQQQAFVQQGLLARQQLTGGVECAR